MLKKLQLISGLLVLGLIAAGCSRASRTTSHLQRADAHFKSGAYDRAEIEYLNVLRLDPTNGMAIRGLALMSHERGELVRSFALLKKAKEQNPDDLEVRLKLGVTLLAGGECKGAREEAAFILDRQPTNGAALVLLADSSFATNDLQDAKQRLERLQALRPEVASMSEFHVARGILELRNRDPKVAEESFGQAVSLGPQSSTAHLVLGNLSAAKNELKQAETELQTAAQLAPLRSAIRLRYIDFLLGTGDRVAAKQLLEEICNGAPDYLPARVRLADLALSERRFHECDAELKTVLARDPVNLEALFLSAKLQLAQGDPAKAVAELERAATLYPRVPQIRYQMAWLLLAKNDLPKALSNLDQALVLQPGYPDATLLLADLNIRRGETASAITSLTKLVSQQPHLTQAQLLLGAAYRMRGDLDAALKVYENLLQANPTNAYPALLMGLALREKGRNAEARKNFEKALELAPNYLPAVEQLIDLDLAEKRFDAARLRAQNMVDKNTNAPQLRLLLAKVYLAQTNFAKAEEAVLKTVELAPDYNQAQQFLAQIYVASGKHKQALEQLQGMVSRNAKDSASWLQIGLIQREATNYPAAKEAFEQFIAISPSGPNTGTVLNDLAWLYSENLGDLNRAYELARRARDLLPGNANAADTLGWVLYRRGEYVRALPLLQESAAKLSEEPEVLFHLGITHYMLGEEGPAKVNLQNALQLGRAAVWRLEAEDRLDVLAIDPTKTDTRQVGELEKKLASRPDDPVVLVRLAAVYERDGAVDKAIAAYEKCLKLNPNSVPAMVKLAMIYSARPNNTKKALELARSAHNRATDDPTISHTLGRLAYQSGDHKWAFSLLQESARKLDKDSDVLFDLALASYSVGAVSNAVVVMQGVLEASPASPHLEEAKTFLKMNAFLDDRAPTQTQSGHAEEVLRRQPDYVPALLVSALAKERAGDFAGARDIYERILKQMPFFTPANRKLALLYFQPLPDPQKAYAHATKAREAFPRDAQVARTLGILEYQRGEFSRAAQLLAESSQILQTDAEVIYYLGAARYKLKQPKESKEHLTKALVMAPNSAFATEAKRLLRELQ